MSLLKLRREVRRLADPERARVAQRFFKTGPGEYAAGDRFVGLTVPQVRSLVKQHRQLSFRATCRLLRSPIHEERLLALLLLVEAFRRGDKSARQRIYDLYLHSTRYINNWDLVDTSAEHIVGAFLCGCGGGCVAHRRGSVLRKCGAPLATLARSNLLWERRIAVLATFHFIKRGEFGPTLRIARQLLRDREDLIHKAVGWMLREIGKRDLPVLEAFLRRHSQQMPRTMLRYAIERFPTPHRQAYLQGRVLPAEHA